MRLKQLAGVATHVSCAFSFAVIEYEVQMIDDGGEARYGEEFEDSELQEDPSR